MKKILENPQAVIYENVEIIKDVLEFYMNDWYAETVAIEILKALKLSLGKKIEIKFYQDNVQAVLENGKITIEPKS